MNRCINGFVFPVSILASDKILFSYKKGIIQLYINLSKSLAKTCIIDIGL